MGIDEMRMALKKYELAGCVLIIVVAIWLLNMSLKHYCAPDEFRMMKN